MKRNPETKTVFKYISVSFVLKKPGHYIYDLHSEL